MNAADQYDEDGRKMIEEVQDSLNEIWQIGTRKGNVFVRHLIRFLPKKIISEQACRIEIKLTKRFLKWHSRNGNCGRHAGKILHQIGERIIRGTAALRDAGFGTEEG